MALGGRVTAILLAATMAAAPPAQPPPGGGVPQDVDPRLLADLEVLDMLDLLRDLEAIRRMDEIMGPQRGEPKGPPGKGR